MITVDYQK